MKKQLQISYQEIISIENLLSAWEEFLPGKRKKRDVPEFAVNLFDNISILHNQLTSLTYVHGGYESFTVNDPKRRDIHKASVRDRVLHHAIYRKLYPFFDKTFIFDSYSCRINKGTHRALNRFSEFEKQASENHRRTVWVLKCDIKKFFASIDHNVLFKIFSDHVQDAKVLHLLWTIIVSFQVSPGKGLPLGNLTSQLFCNIYMNEFDTFVKHRLKARYYIRYADDFIMLSTNRNRLLQYVLPKMIDFLESRLNLRIHQNKIITKTFASGVDFLGWVKFPKHNILRRTTARRILRRIRENPQNSSLQSYLGLIKHGNTFYFKQEILNCYGLWY